MTDTTSVNVNVSQLDLLSKLLDVTGRGIEFSRTTSPM
jgi:hypothetical protein